MSVPEDTPTATLSTGSYNRYSRYLHWLIAGLILFMIFLGWRIGDHDSLRLSRVNLHKSVGILILLLSFVRIAFRLAYKAPPEPPMPAWQALAAKALHLGFYVVMIGMPLTGWLMVSTSAREIPFFGLFPVPHLPVPQTQDAHEFFETFHGLIAKLIIYAMVPLHVIAALKHQFIDKDSVVEHMVPGLTPRPLLNWRWIVPIGVVVLAVGFGYGIYRGVPEADAEHQGPPPAAGTASSEVEAGASAAPASTATASAASSETSSASPEATAVTTWNVDKSASKIAFTTTFSGEAINGTFGNYSTVIAFDAKQLAASHVKVTIDLTSVASGDNDRDSSLKSGDFFATTAFPKAVFEAKSFTQKDAIHFVAHGKLTMHGVTQPCDLPFTLTIKGTAATVSGTTTIDRISYGVGSGDWAKTDAVPAKVTVTITLKANAAK